MTETAAAETRIAAVHRLRTEGRRTEAEAYKGATIKELCGTGLKRVEAATEAWRRMLEEFPPLPVEEPEDGDPGASDESETVEMLEQLVDGPADLTRDTLWCYAHLDDRTVTPDSAPSRGAWSLSRLSFHAEALLDFQTDTN